MRTASHWKIGAAEVVFGVVLVTGLLAGRQAFLGDPGTYWHLRLGRDILQTDQLPRADTLTSTRLGTPWVDQSWAFDVLLATIVNRWGWPGAVAATALGLAWIYAFLTLGLRKDGFPALVAGVVGVLAAGMGAIHFLTRPHLFTFALVLATQRLCRGFHEKGGRAIWLVPPIVAVWANLHGGFLAGPIIVATAVLGHVSTGVRDLEAIRRTRVLMTVFLLTLAAPLLNPYGPGLYRHVHSVLSGSQVTDLIDEYQPSPFGDPKARVLEWVILALVALPVVSRRKPSRYDLVQTLVWLHFALVSIRHAPLFAFAVAPALAALLTGLLTGSDEPGPPPTLSVWPGLVSIAVLFAAAGGVPTAGPDPQKWPLDALPTLNAQPTSLRLFHEQDWGGLIEAECVPRRLAYLDDRFELWGREPILEYIDVLTGGPAWDKVLERDAIELVWLKPDRGLARRLLADPAWNVLYRDKVSVLLRRVGRPSTVVATAGGDRTNGR